MSKKAEKTGCIFLVCMLVFLLPLTIFSEGIIVSPKNPCIGEPGKAALGFVKETNPPTLTSNLKVLKTTDLKSFTSTILYEEINGIPVVGSEVVVNIKNDGKKVFQNRQLSYATSPATLKWDISEEKSLEFAIDHLINKVDENIDLNEELVIFSLPPSKIILKKEDIYQPAFITIIPTKNPVGVWQIIVSAYDGTILEFKDLMINYTGKGRVIERTSDFVNNPSPTGLKRKSLPDMLNRGENYPYDTQPHDYYRTAGKYFDVRSSSVEALPTPLPGTPTATPYPSPTPSFPYTQYAAQSTDGNFNYDSWTYSPWACGNTLDRDRFDETNLYYHLSQGRRYFKDKFKFNLIDYTIPALANSKFYKGNAAYVQSFPYLTPFSEGFVFGNQSTEQGKSCLSDPLTDSPKFNDFSEDPEIIIHELAHLIYAKMNPIASSLYFGEMGGLQEGNSDFWSVMVVPRKKNDPPEIGRIAAQYKPNYIRSLNYYIHYPEIYDNYNNLSEEAWIWDTADSPTLARIPINLDLEVHDAGTVWGPLLYEVYNALGSKGLKLIFQSIYFVEPNTNSTSGFAYGMKAFYYACAFFDSMSYFDKALGIFTSKGVACYRPVAFGGDFMKFYQLKDDGYAYPDPSKPDLGQYKVIKGLRRTFVYKDGFQDLRFEKSGPNISFDDYVIKDDNNGIPEGGETVHLSVILKNDGDELANNVKAILTPLFSTDRNYLTFINSVVAYGSIGIDSTKEATESFVFYISDKIPDQKEIYFQLNILSDEGVWTQIFKVMTSNTGASLKIASIEVRDNTTSETTGLSGDGDLIPEAGETVGITVQIKNEGRRDALNVSGTLITQSLYATVERETVQYGTVQVNEIKEPNAYFVVALSENVPSEVNTADFTLKLTSAEEKWTQTFQIKIYNRKTKLTYVTKQFTEIIGNQDGIKTDGEKIGIDLTIRNIGDDSASIIKATLKKMDSYPYYFKIKNQPDTTYQEITYPTGLIIPNTANNNTGVLGTFEVQIRPKEEWDEGLDSFNMDLELDITLKNLKVVTLRLPTLNDLDFRVYRKTWKPNFTVNTDLIRFFDGANALYSYNPYWYDPGLIGNDDFKLDPNEYVGVLIPITNKKNPNNTEKAFDVQAELRVPFGSKMQKFIKVEPRDNSINPKDEPRNLRTYADRLGSNVFSPGYTNIPTNGAGLDPIYMIHVYPQCPDLTGNLELLLNYKFSIGTDPQGNPIYGIQNYPPADSPIAIPISVSRNPIEIVEPILIDDSTEVYRYNNENTVPEPGEHLDLKFKVINKAPSVDFDTKGTITILPNQNDNGDEVYFAEFRQLPDDNNYIDKYNYKIDFGNLSPNKAKENLGAPIPVFIDPDTGSNSYINFQVKLDTYTIRGEESSKLTYDRIFFVLKVVKPHIIIGEKPAVDDDNLGQSSGDNDNLAEAGETIEYRPKVINQSSGCFWTNSVAYSPTENKVVIASNEGVAKLWTWKTQNGIMQPVLIRILSGHTDAVNAVVYSPDGTKIATASSDKTAILYDANTGSIIRTFTGHTSSVTSIAFSNDGTKILTGSEDKTARLWDANTGTMLLMYRSNISHSDTVTCVAFAPDTSKVITGSADKTVKLWDIATSTVLRTFIGHTETINSIAYSPDGTMILSGSSDNLVNLWDVNNGTIIHTFNDHISDISAVAFSPDGKTFLSAAKHPDNAVQIWDVQTKSKVRKLFGHTDAIESAAFSSDGTKVITGSFDNIAKLWDNTGDGRELMTFGIIMENECNLHNVRAELFTDNPLVTIIDNEIIYGDVKRTDPIVPFGPPLDYDSFKVRYNSSIPYNTRILFKVKIYSDEEPYGSETGFAEIVYSNVQHVDDLYDIYPNNNDTAEWAANVGAGVIQNLICADDDWYKIEVPPNYKLNVRIDFKYLDGDLDLFLYDQYRLDQAALDSSPSRNTDFEEVSYKNTGAFTHYFYVYVKQKQDLNISTEYKMTLELINDTMPPVGLEVDLITSNIVIDDDNIGQSFGNGNGIIEVGETIELYLPLKNFTDKDASNVKFTFGYYDPGSLNKCIELRNSKDIAYKFIESQTYKMVETPAILKIKPNYPVHDPNYFEIQFYYSVTYDMQTDPGWVGTFSLPVKYPKLRVSTPLHINDTKTDQTWGDGDGIIESGETIGVLPYDNNYKMLYDLEATILNFNQARFPNNPAWKRLFRSKVNLMDGWALSNTKNWTVGYYGDTVGFPTGVIYENTTGTWVPYLPDGAQRLNAIDGSEKNNKMIVVGDNGMILCYDPTTNKWNKEDSGVSKNLYDVWVDDTVTSAVAVGEGGVILERTVVNGNPVWTDMSNFKYAAVDRLRGIDYLWTKSVDLHSIAKVGTQIIAVGKKGVMYKLKYGIWSYYWDLVDEDDPNYVYPKEDLFGISFARPDKAYIVGKAGVIYKIVLGGDGNDPGQNKILKIPIINPQAKPKDLVHVWAQFDEQTGISGNYAYAVGANGTFVEIKQYSDAYATIKPCIDSIDLNSVYGFADSQKGFSENNFYVVGGLPDIVFKATTPNPYINFRGNMLYYTVDYNSDINGVMAEVDPFQDSGLAPLTSNIIIFYTEPNINDMTMVRVESSDNERDLHFDFLITNHNSKPLTSSEEQEPNDSFSTAQQLSAGYHNFAIWSSEFLKEDYDYFKYEVPAYSEFAVSLNTEPFLGNLELRLYDDQMNIVDVNIVRDNVAVQCFIVNSSGTNKIYYIRVNGREYEQWENYVGYPRTSLRERNTYILFVGSVPNQKSSAIPSEEIKEIYSNNIVSYNKNDFQIDTNYVPFGLPVPAPTPVPSSKTKSLVTYGYPRSTSMPDVYFVEIAYTEKIDVSIKASNGAQISTVALVDPYDLRRFESIPWGKLTVYQFGTISSSKATLSWNSYNYPGYNRPSDSQYALIVLCSQPGKYKLDMKVTSGTGN